MKPVIVIGLLGTALDYGGAGPNRWDKWRPSVALCQHPDLLVQRFELLHETQAEALAARIAADIATIAPETELRRHPVHFADPWDFEEVYGVLHDFAHAYPFDPEREDYLVHITTGTHVAQICCYLLTEARYFPAKLLQTSPPKRGQDLPGSYAIIDLDLSRYDRIAQRFRREAKEGTAFLKSGIDTRNAAFNALIERIEQVAIRSQAPLLLMGPTGAGKSQLARRIYELKRLRNQVQGRFVEVNCATIRGDAAMSALFGHVKGAFTGALRDRDGLLKSADQGLLFLDEIGELGQDEQAMLLRAVEEKCFAPLGADTETTSHFQLIAGTNRDLQAQARAGQFREDLLARINLWTFRLPGLAARRDDIAPNLDYELERHARAAGQRVTFNKEARERYLAFALSPDAEWRANFRDLAASVTRLATLAPGGRISMALVDDEIERLQSDWRAGQDEHDADDALLPLDLDWFDRVQLREVVRICRASRSLSEAGRTLFAVSRANKKLPNDADRLRKYLSRFGLSWEALRAGTDA